MRVSGWVVRGGWRVKGRGRETINLQTHHGLRDSRGLVDGLGQVAHGQVQVRQQHLRVRVLRDVGGVQGADERGEAALAEALAAAVPALCEGVGQAQARLELPERAWAVREREVVDV